MGSESNNFSHFLSSEEAKEASPDLDTSSDLQILANGDSNSTLMSSSSRSSTNIFRRGQYKLGYNVKRKRKADSDEEYDPMQDSTDNQRKRKQTKKKKSSKMEADSDDESSDEMLVPKRQLSRRN